MGFGGWNAHWRSDCHRVFSRQHLRRIKRELDLIADQSAAQRTTVVLMKPGWDEMDRRLLGVSDDAGQLEFRVLPEALKKRFGEQLVQIANFPSDQDATRTIVDAILKRLVV